MYKSLTNPDVVISHDELRTLYPDIYFGDVELSPSALRDLGLPYTTTNLSALKEEKLTEVDDAFAQHVRGAITTSQGYLMQFDTSDSLKMQGAIQLMETVGQTEGYLTQADDVTVYHIPIATMKAVLMEMLAAYAACHARKQELRAVINAAQSAEELAAIEIAWPV